MEKLNEYLRSLVSTASFELRLEPGKSAALISADGRTDLDTAPILGTQISTMVFPLIPADVRHELPSRSEVEFVHPHDLGAFNFKVQKSPAGFIVTVRPCVLPELGAGTKDKPPVDEKATKETSSVLARLKPAYDANTITFSSSRSTAVLDEPAGESEADLAMASAFGEEPEQPAASAFIPPPEEYKPPVVDEVTAVPLVDRRVSDRRKQDCVKQDRMDAFLRRLPELGATELHLVPGRAAMMRLEGQIQPFPSEDAELSADQIREVLFAIMPPAYQEIFLRDNAAEFSYEIAGAGRFRCSVFADRSGTGGVVRLLKNDLMTSAQIGLPPAVVDLCSLESGLILVTGRRRSGRSTTLGAMLDTINRTRSARIVTIEDPIENIHNSERCLVSQREVGVHIRTVAEGLRSARRESPDVLLVSDVSQPEALDAAIDIASGGSLVLASIDGGDAVTVIDRITKQVAPERRSRARRTLAATLRALISQTLVPRKDAGVAAAFELLSITPEIAGLIREGNEDQIPAFMDSVSDAATTNLNSGLFELIKDGVVDPEDAYRAAVDKAGFESLLEQYGLAT